MKKFIAAGLSIMLALGLSGCGSSQTQQNTQTSSASGKAVKVGIVQIMEHPALDAAREGFLETLKANGYEEGKNLTVEYQSAQNDQSILANITQKFASENLDLVLAIATPAAQSMARASDNTPILITAVTDPVAAGLADSLEKPGKNLTGTTDMNPIKEQFDLLKAVVPNAKKVGVLYNAGEENSQVQVKIAEGVAKDAGLELVKASVANISDVLQAAQSLVNKVDAIYLPTDNTVVSAADSVIQVANQNKIPLIAGESSVVDKGGLGTIGINYKKLGAQTGEMALKILKGEKPATMPIESQKDFDIVFNKETLNLLGIKLPDDLQQKAIMK
ncbi:ABC transporter substrate binding protein [Desulfitobacterium sp.]|uniref:ABC transporter substrate binding protein n=1 Tax=Desulfitobacterium sp. TaxID=49981 RepID=UPI002B203325|nr:ABC transporter substrate binding protein [Desulfitobacterium sp.]MEA4902097.1 ABC transporter substrate binding protein [Desulfitobacterium sp.]